MSTAQLSRVRAMVADLNSRVTDISLPTDTRAEFFNTIGRLQPFVTVRDLPALASCYADLNGGLRPRADNERLQHDASSTDCL